MKPSKNTRHEFVFVAMRNSEHVFFLAIRNNKHYWFLVTCHSDRRDLVARACEEQPDIGTTGSTRTCEGSPSFDYFATAGAPDKSTTLLAPPPVAGFETLTTLEEPLARSGTKFLFRTENRAELDAE